MSSFVNEKIPSKIKIVDPNNDNGVTIKPKTIFDLCDDLLFKIFGYLGTLDLYRISKTYQHFNKIICTEVMKKYEINFHKIHQFCSIHKMLKIFGANLSGLTISSNHVKYRNLSNSKSEELLYLISRHFDNLKYLNVSLNLKHNISDEVFEKFAKKLINLKKITIASSLKYHPFCRSNRRYQKNGSKLLDKFAKIELNNIIEATFCKFKFITLPFSILSNLSALTFDRCDINIDSFCVLMKHLAGQLKYFAFMDSVHDMKNEMDLDDAIKIVNILNDYNPNLITLKLINICLFEEYTESTSNLNKLEALTLQSITSSYDAMGILYLYFINVKHLTLEFYIILGDHDKPTLSYINMFHNLKTLEIFGDVDHTISFCFEFMENTNGLECFSLTNFNITEFGLIDILRNMKNIRCFDISGSRIKLSNKIYEKMLSVLTENDNNQLLINVNAKSIKKLTNYDKTIINVV